MVAPLTIANTGDEYVVKKVGGLADTKHHLGNLGFSEGTTVRVVSKLNNSYIVAVKDARIAIDENLASKIYV